MPTHLYVGKASGAGPLREFVGMALIRTSESYPDDMYAVANDSDYVYIGGYPKTVWKLLKTDLSTSVTSDSLGTRIDSIHEDGEYLYCGAGAVKRLKKTDLSLVDSSVALNTLTGIDSDDDYIYCAGNNNIVYKLDKNTLAVVDNSGVVGTHNIQALVEDGGYVYIANGGRYIIKLDSSDLSVVAQSPEYHGILQSISTDDNYLYTGGNDYRRLWKLNKSDLSLSLEATSTPYRDILAVSSDTNYVYAGIWTANRIYRYSKDTMTMIDYTENIGDWIYVISAYEDPKRPRSFGTIIG